MQFISIALLYVQLQDELKQVNVDKVTNMYSRLKDEILLSTEQNSDVTYDSSYVLFSKYQIPEKDTKDLSRIRDKLETAKSLNTNDINNLTSQRNTLLAKHCQKVQHALETKSVIAKTMNYYMYDLYF